ncbi:myxosortase-dependent phytase-like phosphatase [Archangium sp.]|uniref:myxosortase-dependent phytase-like phosphatase n=1 Tax=Archangium sp. TaxID=1872627 RepID=UPI002EDBB243
MATTLRRKQPLEALVRSRTFLSLAVLLLGLPALAQQTVQVQPTLETQGVLGTGTVVAGAAVWVHPSDPANSLLLVADNQNGLLVYQLDGTRRAQPPDGIVLGVDVQEGVSLGGISQQLVVVANQSLQGLVAYLVDPTTLNLRRAGLATMTAQGFTPNSVALYVSPTTGRVFAFAGSETGALRQFELTATQSDAGTTSTLVRSLNVGGPVVGLAVDDAQGALYVVQQNVGIWRYGAEPDAADARTSVDTVGGGGLVQPLGGVALYAGSGDRGYLLAVNGGADSVRVYDRAPSAHTFRGSFTLVTAGGIDAVENPRHVVVSNRSLGTRFPLGMVAVHDGANVGGAENFKLVPWNALAARFTPNLLVDTGGGNATDGGVPDGGAGGGGEPVVTAPPPPGPPGSVPDDRALGEAGCNCSSVSVSGSVLFVLAGVLLLSRRRRGA